MVYISEYPYPPPALLAEYSSGTVPATGNDESHKLQCSQILSVLMPHRDVQSNFQKISWNQKKQSDWINMTCGYNDICNSSNHSEVLNIIFFTYTCSFMNVPNKNYFQLTTCSKFRRTWIHFLGQCFRRHRRHCGLKSLLITQKPLIMALLGILENTLMDFFCCLRPDIVRGLSVNCPSQSNKSS